MREFMTGFIIVIVISAGYASFVSVVVTSTDVAVVIIAALSMITVAMSLNVASIQ